MHFSSETFYCTTGPSHHAWYWNHGLRWQTSLVCCSCGKWHAVYSIRHCSIWLLQCLLCWCFIFFNMLLWGLVQTQLWDSLHFYVPDGGVLKCNKNICFFWGFITKTRNPLFHPFVLFQAMCFGSVWFTWLKAVIILPLYCIAIFLWSLEMFLFFS